jgi:hypothetical protein
MMRYLVRFKTQQLTNIEHMADREDVYVSAEGDRGWAIVEAEGEESLRRDLLEGQEAEEVQSVLTSWEYVAIQKAREDLENSKRGFVDDPSGALAEARLAVAQALEARGYPPPERANEAPQSRQEILQEYQSTDMGDSGGLEDMRGAFNRLSDLLDRLTRT